MAGHEPDIGLLLARLTGGATIARGDLAQLDTEAWRRLSDRAADHRVQPLLHAEWAESPLADAIPSDVRVEWSSAHRLAAMRSLFLKAELVRLVGLLEQQGWRSIALKGAWLAWHAYPSPAMRPMRDLDLLVDGAVAGQVWEFLLASGHTHAEPMRLTAAEWVQRGRHMPALVSPQGTIVEVHASVWDRYGDVPPNLPDPFDRTRTESEHGGIRYLGLVDTFAHLSVHAAHGHRFDCGPQVMADIDMLVRRAQFDWPAIWQAAQAQGWAKAAALALAVTDRWRRPGLFSESRCPVAVPPDLLAAIPTLMCKPLKEPGDVLVKLARSDVAPMTKLRRLWDRRQSFADNRSWLAWLGNRFGKTARALLPGSGRQQVSAITRLDGWLKP